MKTYDTFEMMREIVENPEEEFVSETYPDLNVKMDYDGNVKYSITDEHGTAWGTLRLNEYFLSQTWVKKDKEVSWQEAIQAWYDDNKSFRVEVDGEVVFRQTWCFRLGLTGASELPKLGIDPTYFREGKWYIVD